MMTRGGTVYILASQPNGTLYIGVTSDLVRRVGQHRSGTTGGFAAEHGVTRLVYFERYDDIRDAIDRETRLKKWNRAWKLRLIRENNPDERDLFDDVASRPGIPLAMPSEPVDSRLRGNDEGEGVQPVTCLLAVLLFLVAVAAPAAGQGSVMLSETTDGNGAIESWRAAAVCYPDSERTPLRWLGELRFWPPPVVALARWTLESVPPDAVLLAQTDGDAVPLRMLQSVEGLRLDVTVVHIGLLGDADYASCIVEDAGLPLPDTLADTVDADMRSDALVAEWAAWALAGAARPLVGALTLDAGVLGRHAPAVVSAGAYQRPGTADEPPFDLAVAESSAGRLRGADFVGPRVSAGDRDPARLASPVDLGGVVLFQLLQTAVSHAQAGDRAAAERAYTRARTFAADAGLAGDPLVGIAREWIDDALAALSASTRPAAGPSTPSVP